MYAGWIDRRCRLPRSLHILIFDEHAPSLAVLCRTLRSRGYTCDVASNVADALAGVASLRPDVVIYEWSLRDGSGLGLGRKLRAASGSVTTVIVVSALNEPERFCETEQVDVYFVKPFDVTRLESVLAG